MIRPNHSRLGVGRGPKDHLLIIILQDTPYP